VPGKPRCGNKGSATLRSGKRKRQRFFAPLYAIKNEVPAPAAVDYSANLKNQAACSGRD
jgi:hypothetical protein